MTQPKKRPRSSKPKSSRRSSEGNSNSQADAGDVANQNIDEHPLQLKHSIVVRYRDGSRRLATIIERSKDSSDEWQYYVHYNEFNRRMDEWIGISRILSLPSEANALQLDVTKADEDAEDAEWESNELKRLKSESSSSVSLSQGPTTILELEHDEHEGMDDAALKEHEEVTKVKNIRNTQFGKHIMECWYFSPYPKEYYPDGPVDMLYVCEFTFRFFKTKDELIRYQNKPGLARHPPGNEIYRDMENKVSMFEVDGFVEKIYCQNLSYFAKLFLDHKTLYFDVDPFLFYVLCTHDERGFHPVGFFSKEKYSDLGFNLACILIFPSAQRKGYGRFLIAFSYELSKKEEKVGSPEKPLSDLGAVSYKSYWASTILRVLRSYPGSSLSVMDIAKMTSIVTEDVIGTLQQLHLLRNMNGNYIIFAPPNILEDIMLKFPVTGIPVDSEKLHWAPLYSSDPRKDKWSIKAKRDSSAADIL
eukprot:CAMPEP_0182426026 /NCGR_PEP_ID=MMETSP1167-20130531/12508_1 /TAXON_ID=2988 /ORGANISM="Mallomonas Sp, Strain CCMP3275" /LENGTH=473 /DNA_ID=CAMNT_0024607177 /DNA_START=29 /DNA_END=1450 /DNA_ORIENTATION=+